MQVSQVAESDTHAVIGGGKAQAFQMSDSAEFFTILSDTLYRDKQRAVVREVICNAWDAHIMVGKTDVPVEVILSDNELIIRDFGPGIAPNRIVPIYCVFGGSTKVKDETQNGGFGLGSKAPFAYSDHFSVTSCHDGFKTVYAISRGGIETEGKPDIREMVRVPTDDSGITVTIPVKNLKDVSKLREHIRLVAMEGGMLVRLNGELLPRFDFTETHQKGFGVLIGGHLQESPVYVLYGTVLYPLTTVDALLSDKVKKLSAVGAPGVHIVLARPNTIGVTPSREALSYTEKTTNALHEVLDRAIGFYERETPRMIAQMGRESAAKQERMKIDPFYSGMLHRYKPQGFMGDPEKILRAAASRQLDEYYNGFKARSTFTRAALRTLSHKFKDSRRILRRAAANPDGFKPKTEAFRYSARLALRLATRIDHLSAFRFINLDGLTPRFVKPQRFNSYPVGETVLIAANQRDADAWCRQQKSGNSVAILVLPKPSEELVARIKTLAKSYKLKVEIAESTKPVPRPKVVDKLKFFAFGDQRLNGSVIGERRLDTAKHYVRIFGASGTVRFPLQSYAMETLKKEYPEAALAWDAEDQRELEKLGAKNLIDVLLDELESYENSPAAQYTRFASEGAYTSHWGKTTTLHRMVKLDLRLARFFFPTKIQISEEIERRIPRLCVWMKAFTDYAIYRDQRDRAGKIIKSLDRAAKEAFGRGDATFSFIKPIVGIKPSIDEVPELLEILRLLKRRANQSNFQHLKEAA